MKTPEYGTLIECIVDDDEDSGIQGMFADGTRSELFNMVRICQYKDPDAGGVYEHAGMAIEWRYPGEKEWRK